MINGFFNPSFAPNGPKVIYTSVSIPSKQIPEWFAGNGFSRNGIKYRPNLVEVGEVRIVGRNQSKSGGSFTFVLGVGGKKTENHILSGMLKLH